MAASKLRVLLSTPFPRLCPRAPLFGLGRSSHSPLTSLPTVLGAHRRFESSCSHPWHGLPPSVARQMHAQASVRVDCGGSLVSPTGQNASFHPWPEWLKLVEHLTAGGYTDRWVSPPNGEDDDSFWVAEDLPEDFRKLAGACLLYARERPDLLRSLSKRDIQVLVENGLPFLFKNGLNTVKRMKSFVGVDGSQVLESEQACTIDLMRYLLSYACTSTSKGGDETRCREIVESSVRYLLHELVKISGGLQEPNVTESTAWHNPSGYEHSPRPLQQNIEMKRGDWICPKCNFMNFARNIKCLECDEARPKRQLTGGEWECPQCAFFNYGRNMTCLRCDCKRPGEISSQKPSIEQLLNSGNIDKTEIERRLAENDEKAERWFSKVSQLDDSSDLSSAIADEDFPEIMPFRKGTNRFVISTRKTPLERKLANARHRTNLGNEDSHMGKDSLGRMGSDKMSASAISQTLDRILGRASATSGTNLSGASGASKDAGNQSVHHEHLHSGRFNNLTVSENVNKQTVSADVSNVQGGATSDNGLPRIVPRHEDENQFVISNRSDHSVTPPHYKRRIAMDQANNPNFVPFVPFPPDYFAKKDKQPEAGSSAEKYAIEPSVSVTVGNGGSIPQRFEAAYSYEGGVNNIGQAGSPRTDGDSWNTGLSRTRVDESKVAQETNSTWNSNPGSGAFTRGITTADGVSASGKVSRQQMENPQKTTESWNHSFPGKSLEGSAVTEPDPLDMSEEAKAQRWFRRVAQIKDISELSKIPDEDFPEIMPMRKGVNRFVVSKRKTPLERKLTSAQYRRNLPVVSSDPGKDPTRD